MPIHQESLCQELDAVAGYNVVKLCTDVQRKSIETQVLGIFNIFLGVLIEDLSDHVHVIDGCAEAAPETLLDLQDRVKSQAIDGVVRRQTLDPVVVSLADSWTAGLEVGKRNEVASNPALRQLCL